MLQTTANTPYYFMKSVFTQFVVVYTITALLCVPAKAVFAEESYSFGTIEKTPTFRFNNDNWLTEEHPRVVSFIIHDDGSASGMTETGIPFVQYNIPNSAGIRVQRFEIEDHYHYIINGEVVYSFEEFSARLGIAYTESTRTSAV